MGKAKRKVEDLRTRKMNVVPLTLGLSVTAARWGAAVPRSGVQNFYVRCAFGVFLRATLSAFILASHKIK